jgi:hypothetical protein
MLINLVDGERDVWLTEWHVLFLEKKKETENCFFAIMSAPSPRDPAAVAASAPLSVIAKAPRKKALQIVDPSTGALTDLDAIMAGHPFPFYSSQVRRSATRRAARRERRTACSAERNAAPCRASRRADRDQRRHWMRSSRRIDITP